MKTRSKIYGITALAVLGILLLSMIVVQGVSAEETTTESTTPMATEDTAYLNEANAYDADGDGIPNCQDEDWTPPMDGTGYSMHGRNMQNGERLCDGSGQMMQKQYRHGYENRNYGEITTP